MTYRVARLLPDKMYYPSLLAYGALGTGKTAFFGQLGAQGLYLDMDRGLRTLVSMNDPWTPLRKTCYESAKSFYEGDFLKPSQFSMLKTHVNGLRTTLKASPEKIILVLDSFTGLVDSIIAYITANSGHPGLPPTIHEWGLIVNEVSVFSRTLKSLPLITVFCGHEMIVEVDDDTTKIKLNCPGKKLPSQIAGFFDDVFYCTLKKKAGGESDYWLTSKATRAVEARTRSSFREDWNMNDGLWKFLEKLGYVEEVKS